MSQNTTKKTPKVKTPVIPESETVVIKRSQINFAIYNPKKHTDDDIKKQIRNFKKVGFLGGIVWNETTGNLISGHKRVMAMDKIFGNTEATPVNYDIRVEMVRLDAKQEMEQNVFMDARSTNTQQDLQLLAEMLPMIDPKEAGLEDIDIQLIVAETPELETNAAQEYKDDFKAIEKPYEERKEAIKELKKQIKDETFRQQGTPYITLSFDSYENKAQFLETLGYDSEQTIIKGEEFFERVNK